MANKRNVESEVESLQCMTQGAAAWLIGLTARQLRNYKEAPRNDDGTYSGQRIVAWWGERNAAEKDLCAGPVTDNLDRLRRVNAEINELKLEQMRSNVVGVRDVVHVVQAIFTRVRQAIERLQREYGNDAGDVIIESITDAERDLESWIKSADS